MTPALSEIVTLLSSASRDEERVALGFVRRLMLLGRATHGPMHLANDGRDLHHERACEQFDDMAYTQMQIVKDGYRLAVDFPELPTHGLDAKFDTSDDEPPTLPPVPGGPYR